MFRKPLRLLSTKSTNMNIGKAGRSYQQWWPINMETGCLVIALSRSRGSLGRTKKATRSGTGDRNWSEIGIIGIPVNDAISLVSNTSAMNALTKRYYAEARPS